VNAFQARVPGSRSRLAFPARVLVPCRARRAAIGKSVHSPCLLLAGVKGDEGRSRNGGTRRLGMKPGISLGRSADLQDAPWSYTVTDGARSEAATEMRDAALSSQSSSASFASGSQQPSPCAQGDTCGRESVACRECCSNASGLFGIIVGDVSLSCGHERMPRAKCDFFAQKGMLDSESSVPGRPWTCNALSHGLDDAHFIPEIPSRLDFIPEHHVRRLRLGEVDALPRTWQSASRTGGRTGGLGRAQAEPEASAEISQNDTLPQVPARLNVACLNARVPCRSRDVWTSADRCTWPA
jgi:hypothetical protein